MAMHEKNFTGSGVGGDKSWLENAIWEGMTEMPGGAYVGGGLGATYGVGSLLKKTVKGVYKKDFKGTAKRLFQLSTLTGMIISSLVGSAVGGGASFVKGFSRYAMTGERSKAGVNSTSLVSVLPSLGMPVLKKANGGYISGAGTTTSDSIPAMLSNKEFVVNAKQTSKFRPILERINSGSVTGFNGGTQDYTTLGGIRSTIRTVFKNSDLKVVQDRLAEVASLQSKLLDTTIRSEEIALIDRIKKLNLTKESDDAVIVQYTDIQKLYEKIQDTLERMSKDKKDKTMQSEKQRVAYIDGEYNLIKDLKKGLGSFKLEDIKKREAPPDKSPTKALSLFGDTDSYNAWRKKHIEATDTVTGAFREGFVKAINKSSSFSDSVNAGFSSLRESFRKRMFSIGEAYISNAFKPIEKAGTKALDSLFSGLIPPSDKDEKTDTVLGDTINSGLNNVTSNLGNKLDQGKQETTTLGGIFTSLFSVLSGWLSQVVSALFGGGGGGGGGLLGSIIGAFTGGGDGGGDSGILGSIVSAFTGGGLSDSDMASIAAEEGVGVGDIAWGYSSGGIVAKSGQKPLYFNQGGFVPRGTDTVPAMLTPGEVVLNPALGHLGSTVITQNYNIKIDGDFDQASQERFKKMVASNTREVNASNIEGNRSQNGLGR
jgi:hypothetical protein